VQEALFALMAGLVLADLAIGVAHAAAPSAHPSPPRPTGNPGEWASDDDYPVAALRDSAQGVVGFALTVGKDGAPTQCAVRASSGNADLDRVTCELMLQRARFVPATNAAGAAVIGTYANTIRWQLPDDGKYSVDFPGEVRLEYDVAADGTVSNCRLTSSGDVADYLAKDEAATRCANLGPFARQTDKAGKPVGRHVVKIETTIVTNLP
jgi:protein TonB